MSECIFCRIVRGAIPCAKVAENANALAFMDVGPLSRGHVLVIPKEHAQFMHEVSGIAAADVMKLLSKVGLALSGESGMKQYNILQNNGSMAHQVVPHVHFHVIPKPNPQEGLSMSWNPLEGLSSEDIQRDALELQAAIDKVDKTT